MGPAESSAPDAALLASYAPLGLLDTKLRNMLLYSTVNGQGDVAGNGHGSLTAERNTLYRAVVDSYIAPC